MSRALIRPYRPGDEAAINDGFNQVFGLQRPLEEWRWKFSREASLAGDLPIFLAEEAGEVVAHFAAIPVALTIDGRRVIAGHVVDVFSRRRHGVFVRLVNRFYAELCGPEPGRLALVYGFPGERHFQLGVKKLRYSEPLPVAFRTRSAAAPPPRGTLWNRIAGWRISREPDLAAVDHLWQRAAHRYPVSADRDGAWLRRRFLGRPGVEYVHLVVERKGLAGAVAVVRLPDPAAPVSVLQWAELVWDGRRGALEALDGEVANLCRESGAAEAHLWLGNDPQAEEVLSSRGWQRADHPQGLCLGAVSFHPEIDASDLCRRLYLTQGDGDLV